MFVLGPLLATVPFFFAAKMTIPDRRSLVSEFKIFSSKTFSLKKRCRMCKDIPCRMCSFIGRAYTNVFTEFNLLRFATKDLHSLAEATNAFGDKYMFQGEFTCWQCVGATPGNPGRYAEAQRVKASLDQYLSNDAERLRFVKACYAAFALYLFLRF